MDLEGLHHVTAITGDAPRNVDFYARLLGLRLVKKTVNFDAPDVYHLYFGVELGTPGSIMTFFEFPGARRGRPGAGMVHTVCWRVGSAEALGFWEQRLADEGVAAERRERVLRFDDPEGLTNALVVADAPDEPLVAAAPDVPAEHAIQGFHGVRAYASDAAVAATEPLLEALGMQRDDQGRWLAAGAERRGQLKWDAPPPEPGIEGAGSVHHIAWNAADDAELAAWRGRVAGAGGTPRRSSTASTSTPSTSAPRPASCSSWPAATSASTPTSRRTRSARRSSSRRSTSTCASGWSGR